MFAFIKAQAEEKRVEKKAVLPGPELNADEEMVNALEGLLGGQFEAAKHITGRAGKILGKLAVKMESEAIAALERTADLSMHTSVSMTSVSWMSSDIRQMSENSQIMTVSVGELTSSINQLAENIGETTRETEITEDTAQTAAEDMQKTILAMRRINEAVQNMSVRLTVLERAAGQIGGMAQTIEEISDQTKLLALNATVEASRAGEAGKGFGVVASEVKSLSEQTSRATDQIRERVGRLNTEMSEMASAIETSAGTLGDSGQVINDAGERINQISQQITRITGRMNDIANDIEQQCGATSEISGNIAEIANSSDRTRKHTDIIIQSGRASGKLVKEQFSSMAGMNIPNCMLARAKSDHMIWMKKLAGMLVGMDSLKPDELADHHSCRLGKWYDRVDDPAIANHPSFKALAEPHKLVHRHGKAAAAAIVSGNRVSALDDYSKMKDASAEVMRLLNELTGAG